MKQPTRQPLLLLLALLVALTPFFVKAQEASELGVNSTRYLVMNAETGEIYAQRGAQDEVAIASLTKVMTAIQAISMAPLDTLITTKEVDLAHAEATAMGFGPDETYTLRDMLYGMMLPSGNDAAWAIARSLGHQEGDTDEEAAQRFIDLMNRRALDMGLEHTHFLNPDGWGVDGHYSTAADIAAITAYAMEFPFLMDVMGTVSYTTSNGLLTVGNSNKSLNLYPSVLGGKTGYDWDSGWCLVNIAERDGERMIAVTLDGVAPDDWYNDNATLLDYGFEQQEEARDDSDGESVAWHDPDAAQLARMSSGTASVSGTVIGGDDDPHRETITTSRDADAYDPSMWREAIGADPGTVNGPVIGSVVMSSILIWGAVAYSRWTALGGSFTKPSRPVRKTEKGSLHSEAYLDSTRKRS